MFKYNELSDLKSGELVTPIKTDEEYIICLDSEGNEKKYLFDDFDFDKTIEERQIEEIFIVDDEEQNPENKQIIEEREKSRWLNDDEKIAILNSLKKTAVDIKSVNIYCDII